MSEMTTKVEIEDVLSSIRRLVSEDVRYARPASPSGLIRDTARWTPPAAAEPLVLTPSLRVAAAQDAPAEVEAVVDDAAAAGAADSPGADAATPIARADRGLRASLEETIAELEAAITGSGGEWEPDGSEVTPAVLAFEDFAPQTDASAPVEAEDDPGDSARENAFDIASENASDNSVDTGEGVLAGMSDAELHDPVIGLDAEWQDDVTTPSVADEAAAALREEATDADLIAALDAAAEMEFAEGAAGLSAPQDDAAEIVAETVAPAEDGEEIKSGRPQLVHETEHPDDDPEGLEWCAPGTPDPTPELVEASGVIASKAVVRHDALHHYSRYLQGDWTGAQAEPNETAAADTTDAADMAEPDPGATVAPDVVAESARPVRRLQLSAVAEPAQPASLRDREADTSATAGPAAPADDIGAEDDGLFGDECEVLVDEDMLRAVVAEIIRQELQGTLGERITRNVRKLVRHEIQRALTAQEFD